MFLLLVQFYNKSQQNGTTEIYRVQADWTKWIIKRRTYYVDFTIPALKLQGCSVGFTVCLLWIMEAQVVWCEKQSIATSVWDLQSEMRSTNHVTGTSVVVLISHMARQDTYLSIDAAFKSFFFFFSTFPIFSVIS